MSNRESNLGEESGNGAKRKLGLALSGGGFRAAFFHIGALARMAELGLLQQVEVISTVSGGSIIGALYYLHVKWLLESKPDVQIAAQDYVGVVADIEKSFLATIEKNLRMRTFSNLAWNLKMMKANYSRSDRLGELYDDLLYRPYYRARVNPSSGKARVEMQALRIAPRLPSGNKDTNFDPQTGNAGRTNSKVPILLINATTLNTGHNWRFEAVRMGEYPSSNPNSFDIDKNLRLCEGKYATLPDRLRKVPLGIAVAASSAVPGIFHPLAVSNMYPDHLRVQLVDGGVHDNQGIQGLLDFNCTHFIVSDASGRMEDEEHPATYLLPVLSRTGAILQDRLRETQMLYLENRYPCEVAFFHLRRGLAREVRVPLPGGGQPPPVPAGCVKQPATSSQFGVPEEVQEALSRIRTDLDSFTEVEAFSLMLDGYLMSEKPLDHLRQRLVPPPQPGKQSRWRFQAMQPFFTQLPRPFVRQLEVASRQALKVFWLRPVESIALTLVLLAPVILMAWLGQAQIAKILTMQFTLGSVLLAIGLLAGSLLLPKFGRVVRAERYLRRPAEKFILRVGIRGVLPVLAWAFVNLHLYVFDKIFLWNGRVRRLR